MKKKIIPCLALIGLLMPLAVLANGASGTLYNPLKCDSLLCVFIGVMRLLLGAVGVFAVFVFMWGGFLMLTSGGNAEQVKKAKDALLWASIGVVTIIASWVLVQFLMKTMIDATLTS